jgi:ribonuclease HI
MKEVKIWTDGACSPNPGAGGWGAILKMGDYEKEISGAEENSTNNQMEMLAAIKALQMLKQPCKVTLHSDSEYIVKGMNQDWVSKWENNNWETSSGSTPKNLDYWQALKEQDDKHNIEWVWVKGHSDNEYNNRCDELAVAARLELIKPTAEEQSHKVLGSLKQALTRLRTAHRIAKKIDLELEEETIKSAKKATSKLVRELEKELKGEDSEKKDA